MKLTSRSNHPANRRGFFKIIVSEISPESMLMIPKAFVKNHEEDLRGRVHLKASGSAPWPVDVVRTKGEVWLQSGWPEFAKSYSLCFGSVLIFEYLEHSNFRVRVFDASATEIDYTLTCNPNLDDGELAPRVRKRETEIGGSSKCELVRTCKKTRAGTEEAFHNGPKLKLEKANGDQGSASEEEKERAINLARAYKSEKPFYIMYMRPSYVRRNGVEIRRSFQETYRKWKTKDQIVFQVGRRSWPVNYTLSGDRCILTTGWMTFIRDKSLKVDDVCVFELINPSRKLFKVIIFRAKCEAA